MHKTVNVKVNLTWWNTRQMAGRKARTLHLFLKQSTWIKVVYTHNRASNWELFKLPLIPLSCQIFSFLNFYFPSKRETNKTDVIYLKTIYHSTIHYSTVLIKVVQNQTFFSVSNMLAARSVALLLCCNKSKQNLNAHYLPASPLTLRLDTADILPI